MRSTSMYFNTTVLLMLLWCHTEDVEEGQSVSGVVEDTIQMKLTSDATVDLEGELRHCAGVKI